jgi:acetyltransferase-like isoleucine patch superfamily enzyme
MNKTLSGKPSLPSTAQLVDERDPSWQASFRFNTAVQKDSGEPASLFRRIVAAKSTYPCAGERYVTSYLDHGINVTALFHWAHGCNASIGENVVVGSGSQILDSGRVVIGSNTKIGACVTISTLEDPNDMRSLTGSERTETTREVFIGENVYIGDGCIIQAGVRIGNNTIVRAGSVVVQASTQRSKTSLSLR